MPNVIARILMRLKYFSVSCLNLEVSLDFVAFSLLAKKRAKNMAKLGCKHFNFTAESRGFFSIGYGIYESSKIN
jgi:hypothetical protein